MTMEESFHFALLRISIVQILKASGFDKCRPSVLNTLTDIYVQYFRLLTQQAIKLARHRRDTDETVELQDVTQALINISLIKPDSFERYLNCYDIPPFSKVEDKESNLLKNYNTKSAKSFVDWVKFSDSFRISKQLSVASEEFTLNIMEKRRIDSDDSSEQSKKKRHKEKQDYYNQLKLNDNTTGNIVEEEQDDQTGSKHENISWLNYLIEKDLKLGHDFKFFNTSLFGEFMRLHENTNPYIDNSFQSLNQDINNRSLSLNKNEHILLNVDETNEDSVKPSARLNKILPYNLTYGSALEEDDTAELLEKVAVASSDGGKEGCRNGTADEETDKEHEKISNNLLH